ncbi:MAG TPA: alpha/beta hydrolase [Thermomicrobiales bacterium]|nr:alpha/beta hydrolase [Thermomicrobiales bacterium]
MPQVKLRDFTMHYLERGAGEPLVFVAGFISTHRWWQPTLERLPADRYHCYAVDLRATGESEAVETGHTLERYAEDLEEFAEAIGLTRFTLVGHSMGGGVATLYALSHPERLKALVLVDPLAPTGTAHLTPEITEWLNAQQGNPEGIRALVLGAFARPPEATYLDQLVADGVRWGPAVYLGTMGEMARFDVVDRLTDLAVPTLVTWGDRDTVIPFAGIVELFTRVPGCALEIWHGVGHSAPIEIPERFADLLTRFTDEATS